MLKTLQTLTLCKTHIFYGNSSEPSQNVIFKELQTPKIYHFKAYNGNAICLSSLVVYISSVFTYNIFTFQNL